MNLRRKGCALRRLERMENGFSLPHGVSERRYGRESFTGNCSQVQDPENKREVLF